MKAKRMAILFVVFAVLTLLIVLSSVVFTVQSISVDWVSTIDTLSTVNTDTIVKSAGINYGKNMFFINKDKAISNIEKDIPYGKVVNIESVFPNKLVIHMTEREPVLAVATSGEDYLICDGSMKVLEIVDQNGLNAMETRPIIVSLEQETISDSIGRSYLGSVLSDDYFDKVNLLFQHLYSLGYDNQELCATISKISYGTLSEDNMNIETYYGNDLVLCKLSIKYKEKVTLAMSVYEEYKVQGKSGKQIKVFTNTMGEVIASELIEQ